MTLDVKGSASWRNNSIANWNHGKGVACFFPFLASSSGVSSSAWPLLMMILVERKKETIDVEIGSFKYWGRGKWLMLDSMLPSARTFHCETNHLYLGSDVQGMFVWITMEHFNWFVWGIMRTFDEPLWRFERSDSAMLTTRNNWVEIRFTISQLQFVKQSLFYINGVPGVISGMLTQKYIFKLFYIL